MSTPNKNTSLAVVPQQQTSPAQWEPENLPAGIQLAEILSKGNLLPSALRGKPSDVLVVLMTGRELGLSPMQSIRSVHVIDGKGVLSADMLVALCKRRRDVCAWFRMTESSSAVATYETHRLGDPGPVKMSFTIAEAQAAGLVGKDVWKKYPAAMLRARCSAALARAVYPDLCAGLYDPEELDDARPRAATPDNAPAQHAYIDATAETVQPAPVAETPEAQAEATQEDKEKLMDQLADFGAAQTQAEVVAIKDAHKADWPDGHPLSAAFKEAFTAAYKRTKTSSPIPAA